MATPTQSPVPWSTRIHTLDSQDVTPPNKTRIEPPQQCHDKEQQSVIPRQESSPGRGKELTELAMPSPTCEESNPQIGWEINQLEARKSRDRDAALAEIAAPSPLDDRDHDEYPDRDEHRSSSQNLEDLQATQSQQQRKSREYRKSTSSSNRRKSVEGLPQPTSSQGPPDDRLSRALSEFYAVSWLIFFSLLGTLARLGVEAVTLYPNSPVTSRVLWANLGGSFFLGFLAEDRRLFRDEWGSPDPRASISRHAKIKKTIPLYIGLATGFCGSFTSFSSYIRDCFLTMSNDLAGPSPTVPHHSEEYIAPRSGGFSFLALLAVLILHPAVSLAALNTGAQFTLLVQPVTPVISHRFTRKILDPFGILLGWGCWLGSVILSIFPPGNANDWRSRATLSLCFAPLGCLLRFYISRYFNARIPRFPLGTFAVNVFGTMILGMSWDLQHYAPYASTQLSCAFLYGVQEGFCGCLTTVSTWVAELQGLKRRHSWIYGLVSVGVAFGFMVAIMGGMAWTVGFTAPVCG